MMFPISLGAQIYFAEGAETLAANMLEARPTLMTAVPRLYETLHRRIRLGVERRGGVSRRLFDKAVAIGRKRRLVEALSLGERLLDPVLDRLVRAKLRRRFGGRLKAMVSGGAPLNPEIGSFFVALGVRLLQGYGQTEAAPVIACNPPVRIKIDTVGPPLDGVRVRIADDGEILVAGDNVMKGYWNDPEATAQVLAEGWLKTGDVGFVDDDGYIRITDRKRDFIKNSGGETISPARVEGYLTLEPEIAQAMVFGDRRPYLVAVLVPDPDFAAAYLPAPEEPAGDFRALAADHGFARAIGAVVARVNQGLSPVERVRRFVIAGGALYHRQRSDDADPEDQAPCHPGRLWRRPRRALRKQGHRGLTPLPNRVSSFSWRPGAHWLGIDLAVEEMDEQQHGDVAQLVRPAILRPPLGLFSRHLPEEKAPAPVIRVIRHPGPGSNHPRGSVLAMGNFDGLHRGHAVLIGRVRDLARQEGRPVAVLTFEPHPRSVFLPAAEPFRLTPFRVKERELAQARRRSVVRPAFRPQLCSQER